MASLHFVCLLSILACVYSADSGHSWNYYEMGPDAWPHEFHDCSGKAQSPINFDTTKLEYDHNLKQFSYVNYAKELNWNVSHNGHSVVISPIKDGDQTKLSVKGSDFDQDFELLQFHFHWGFNDFQGSEHYVDGEKFPLEMHLVHKSNEGVYSVLGFLFKLSKTNNPALNPLLKAILVAKDQDHWKIATLALSSILPDLTSLDKYYRYSGSFTTPPCTEGVKWNLFSEYIEISSEQLKSFRNNSVRINFREPQKLYSRKVFSSFKNAHMQHSTSAHGGSEDECSRASGFVLSQINLALLAVSSIIYQMI